MKAEMPYIEAKALAEKVMEQLAPHCYRIEIAGSIMRKKEICGDIEIVAISKPYEVGLFESGIAKVVNQWNKVKGEFPCKYTQRILPNGIKLDLFFATEQNWGLILAIRTGSAEFSKNLAKKWVACGYHSVDGNLSSQTETMIPIREEQQLFRLLGIDYVQPENRI